MRWSVVAFGPIGNVAKSSPERRLRYEHPRHHRGDGDAGCWPILTFRPPHVVRSDFGRIVDQFGAHRMTIAGLIGMAVGSSILPMLAARFGEPGYIVPLVVITAVPSASIGG